jgi:carboxyl-terminal processing protease
MKKILIPGLLLLFSLPLAAQKTINSGTEKINVVVGGKVTDWRISPEANPDRLKVYCPGGPVRVVFETDRDTAVFLVNKNDTIRFKVILRSKETANTEIVGFRDIPNSISAEAKIYWLSRLWSDVKYNFINIDQLGFNLDSIYNVMIPQVLATKNDYDFYQALHRFMASMHDGHTMVTSNGQFYNPFMDYIPVSLNDFDERIYITAVRKIPGLDSSWVGAEVTAIDGMPAREYMEKNIFPYISASTKQHLWMQGIYQLQSDFKDRPFRAAIRKSDGSTGNIIIQRNGEEIRKKDDKYWGTLYDYPQKTVTLTWLPDSIASINIIKFYPEEETEKQIDEAIKGCLKAKGLIIDLRQNGGGSTEVAWHLQKYLSPGKWFLNYGWETRVNDGVGKANGNWIEKYRDYYLDRAVRFEKPDTVMVPDSLKRIKCPVVILMGRFTFSAGEDFLVNIYEVPGRPLLIGEETGGSTGSPLVVDGLPGGGYARICTRRICYPYSGKRFVNSGVKPDIEVKPGISDYMQKKDVIQERAVAEIQRIVKTQNTSPKK